MCELLVFTRDKEDGPNAEHNLVKHRRGDVIVAMPDGHDWTETERTGHPEWTILKVPGMSLAEGQALAHPEPEEPTRRLFHRRLFHIDLDHSEAHPVVKALARRTTAGANVAMEVVDADHLRTVVRRKPSVDDPNVIGAHRSPNVIG